jgi:hypothetical protein
MTQSPTTIPSKTSKTEIPSASPNTDRPLPSITTAPFIMTSNPSTPDKAPVAMRTVYPTITALPTSIEKSFKHKKGKGMGGKRSKKKAKSNKKSMKDKMKKSKTSQYATNTNGMSPDDDVNRTAEFETLTTQQETMTIDDALMNLLPEQSEQQHLVLSVFELEYLAGNW